MHNIIIPHDYGFFNQFIVILSLVCQQFNSNVLFSPPFPSNNRLEIGKIRLVPIRYVVEKSQTQMGHELAYMPIIITKPCNLLQIVHHITSIHASAQTDQFPMLHLHNGFSD